MRVVPNRFPAFAGTEPLQVTRLGPIWEQAPGNGVHEVLVLSPSHDQGWADLDDSQAALVMAAMRDRMEQHGRLSHPGLGERHTLLLADRESSCRPLGQLSESGCRKDPPDAPLRFSSRHAQQP